MRRLSGVMVILFIFALAISACGTQEATPAPTPTPVGDDEPTGPPQGGTVTMGLEGDPERFVTTIWPMASAIPVHQLVFGQLVAPNEEMEFVPDLAESVDISQDGLTITFTLRKDVLWHDGEPFTARDVAFTFNMMAHPDYHGGQDIQVAFIEGVEDARAGVTDGMSGIEIIDDHTIAFTCKEPYAPALSQLTMRIIPEHILGDVPIPELDVHEFNYNAIGTGPFRLVEYVPDRHVILEAFDDYFGGRPNIDRIIWRIASHEALLSSWLRQEIDIVSLPVAELDVAEGVAFGYVHEHASERPTYLGLNCQSVYFSDVRVRQALSYALDREEIVDIVIDGNGQPISQNHPATMWAYNPNIPVPEQDLDKAGQLLDDAGWILNTSTGVREKDGIPFDIEMWYVTDREDYQPDLAALVQAQLKPVGINVSLRAWDSPSLWPTVLPRGEAADPDAYEFMIASISITSGDPNWVDRYLVSTTVPPYGINYFLYQNEEMDRLIEQQSQIMDFDERRDFWHNTLWPYINDEMPFVPILNPSRFFAVNNRVVGFDAAINSRVNNVLNWYIDE